VTDSSRAVFLSYASEDAEAAQRIADALRTAGVEVWFDQSELRGGDVWDHKIRQQIRDCALFVPIISEHTQARAEGYFRLEWDEADQRRRMIAHLKAFIVPVCVDATKEKGAVVPESFLKVQWSRLTGGNTLAAYCERIKRLLSDAEAPERVYAGARPPTAVKDSSRRWILFVAGAVLAAAAIGWGEWRLSRSKAAAPIATAALTFHPPPHSIAVLPFVNMSGDKEQAYFSEGLTEELLNSLARLNELHVAARTSSFSFEGQHPDIATVAHKLNVGAVLEGSVRRSGQTVRITTQLISGVTGYQIWSQTYDRNLGDILKLQTDIANAVASALRITLAGNVTAKVEMGGTRNSAAFDVHLRASKNYMEGQTGGAILSAIEGFTESIRLDADYALAYADRSLALASFAVDWAKGPERRATYSAMAQADARKAIALAPELAEGHLALATVLTDSLEFIPANQEFERAVALAPGNARVLRNYGLFAAQMGKFGASLPAAYRSVELDPLNPSAHGTLGWALVAARRYGEAIVALKDARALAQNDSWINSWLGYAYYRIGDLQSARVVCEAGTVEFINGFCLALVYDKLGRHADAESMLGNMRRSWGDEGAMFYAMIYTEWGDRARALDCIETAMQQHNPYLTFVRTRFDPLRQEPRFQAIEQALQFPD
jgi:TolB-like protein/tetratricopeptide (TPR) repeat protein